MSEVVLSLRGEWSRDCPGHNTTSPRTKTRTTSNKHAQDFFLFITCAFSTPKSRASACFCIPKRHASWLQLDEAPCSPLLLGKMGVRVDVTPFQNTSQRPIMPAHLGRFSYNTRRDVWWCYGRRGCRGVFFIPYPRAPRSCPSKSCLCSWLPCLTPHGSFLAFRSPRQRTLNSIPTPHTPSQAAYYMLLQALLV